MKKLAIIAISLALFASSAYAAEGEMGCFGGISTGVKMETLTSLAQTTKKKSTSKYTLPYKENIYLTGVPETVEGTIEYKPGKGIDKEKGQGTYTDTYKMTAQNAAGTSKISRSVTFEVQYTYDASIKQARKNTTVKKWSEIITVNGKTYQLDSNASEFTKSILEDYKGTPEYTIISNLLLRNMAKAKYSTENIGHFAGRFRSRGSDSARPPPQCGRPPCRKLDSRR